MLPWPGLIFKEGDVIVVRNPKEPMFKGEPLTFVEELVIPTAGPKDQYLISEIRNLTLDEEGRICVLDRKSSDIKVFNPAGKYLRTIGRKGQGPGELYLPTQISINRKRNELCVFQSSRRISFFSLDGTFLRNLSTRTIWGGLGEVDSAGNIVLTEWILGPPDSSYALKKFDANMNFVVELARTPANKPTAFDAFLPVARWTIDDQDNVVYGYPKTYEILIFNVRNQLIRKIQKEYDPVKVTDEEVALEKENLPEGLTPAFSKYRSAFRNIRTDEEGRIYVQTWRKDSRGQYVFYDLFDKEGKYLAALTLRERAMMRKGKMYSVEEDEDGYQTIKRYAIVWNLK